MTAVDREDSSGQPKAPRTAPLLIASVIVAALGSLLFGFDTAVINGTTKALTEVYDLSKDGLGLTVMSALIGTMIGSLLAGRPADWWGRRPVLAVLAGVFVVASFGCAWAWNWHALVAFRILGGVAVGGASVISPMYITEVAPARRRGTLVAVAQLNIVIGILLAYCSNYLVVCVLGTDYADNWRWMFGVMALPALMFLGISLCIPESPRWLIKSGRREQAETVLRRFGHENPSAEAAEIAESLRSEAGSVHVSLWQRKYMKPLLLAAMVAAFNQLDGINAILYYATDIFRMAGADEETALKQPIILGLTNLVLTLVAMVLIDRVGRKALLLTGSVTFILSHALAAWVFWTHADGWIAIVALMGIVGSHAYSQGAVVWAVINELLPNAIRASGAAVVCCLLWVLCAGIAWKFPVIAEKSGAGIFAFFAMMMVLQFVLVWKFLPETKGASLESLERQLGGQA
jgi:sugar porter (SP) family MFS transporter